MKTRHWMLFGVVLFAGFAWQLLGAWQDSQTSDEGNHLAAGIIYWQTGDFKWNSPHPPLVKLMAAAPLVVKNMVKVDRTSAAWKSGYLKAVVIETLYRQTGVSRPQLYYFFGRLPVIAFWLLLAATLFFWSRARWSFGAGFLAMSLFVFDPNFLGHGHLINTDVPVTAMMFAVVWAADRYFRRPRWPGLLLLAILFALTQMTKFSAVILWPMILALGAIKVWTSRRAYSWRQWWILFGTLVGMATIITWATYGFEVRRLYVAPDSAKAVIRVVGHIKMRLPAAHYWRGLHDVILHNEEGHATFINGKSSFSGRWYYFPEAVALKTPLLTLTLFFVWLGVGAVALRRMVRRHGWRWPPFNAWLFGLPPLVYFATSLTGNLNIGLRHVFPVYPFVFMAIGSLTTLPLGRFSRWRNPVIIGIIVISAAVAWRAWPNTISYFNALAGGSGNGQRYLLDSNLDWGQDVWRLRYWLDRQRFSAVRMSVYTSIPLGKIFPGTQPMIFDKDVAAGATPRDVIVVSKDNLYDPERNLLYLRNYQPRWRIGSSILVYDFRG